MNVHVFTSLLLIMLAVQSAAACPAEFDAEHYDFIDIENPNQQRIDGAVRILVNQQRCKEGLPLVTSSPALIRVAAAHSKDMVRLGFLSHESPVSGKRRFSDRIKAEGVGYREAAENISQRNVYTFEKRKFIIEDAASCKFSYLGSHRSVPQHSYKSLAQSAVKGWMASTGHRLNILTRSFRKIGTGMAIDRSAPHCGDVLLTQNFIG